MLDNYTPQELKEDARRLKGHYPHVVVEASGVCITSTAPGDRGYAMGSPLVMCVMCPCRASQRRLYLPTCRRMSMWLAWGHSHKVPSSVVLFHATLFVTPLWQPLATHRLRGVRFLPQDPSQWPNTRVAGCILQEVQVVVTADSNCIKLYCCLLHPLAASYFCRCAIAVGCKRVAVHMRNPVKASPGR